MPRKYSGEWITEKEEYEKRITTANIAVDRWRGRAERVLGQLQQMEVENARLRDDNVRLAKTVVELASKPAQVIQAPEVDIAAILDGIKRIVSPDVVVSGRPDASDEQRAGIVWRDQGLDNEAGVREYSTQDVERFTSDRASIPDYVLDIEKITEDQINQITANGSKGGWYNPK